MYGVFRVLIEFVREPDIQLGYLAFGWVTMGQVLSLPLIIVGAAVLIYAAKTKRPQEGIRRSSSSSDRPDTSTQS